MRNKSLLKLVIVSLPFFFFLKFAFAENAETVKMFVRSAEAELEKGDFVSAERDIKKALEISKENQWALRVLARFYRKKFQVSRQKEYLDLAKGAIERALKPNPNDPGANADAVFIYYYLRDKAKALRAIDVVVQNDPKSEYWKGIKNKILSM